MLWPAAPRGRRPYASTRKNLVHSHLLRRTLRRQLSTARTMPSWHPLPQLSIGPRRRSQVLPLSSPIGALPEPPSQSARTQQLQSPAACLRDCLRSRCPRALIPPPGCRGRYYRRPAARWALASDRPTRAMHSARSALNGPTTSCAPSWRPWWQTHFPCLVGRCRLGESPCSGRRT